MGGEINLESKLGHGATFIVQLDLEIGSALEDLAAQLIENPRILIKDKGITNLNLNILLVDDSENNRLLIKAFLKKSNCNIVEAENGKIAFKEFKKMRFDIVFMDMQMPIMDGNTATTLLREWEKKHNYARTPIYALTAFALKEEQNKSIEAGCDGHIAKPVSKKMIIDVLNSVVNSQSEQK